jgi:hypothetical protein
MEAQMPAHLKPTPTDAEIAQARAVVLDANAVACHPALIQSAWAILKEARGQNVDLTRLQPAHIIGPTDPGQSDGGFVAQADAARGRLIPIIRRRMADLGISPRDFGGAA